MNRVLIVIVVAIGIVSAFALSPYFTESTIDEALPTGAIIQPTTEEAMTEEAMTEEAMTEEAMTEEAMTEEAMTEEAMTEEAMTEEAMTEEAMTEEAMTEEAMTEEAMTEEAMTEEAMTEEAMTEEIHTSYAGTFIGVGDGIHDAEGDAYTILLEDGSNVLRLENFKSTNGPDLYVYLSTDENASEFINLGKLKANNGNQNYEIPDDAIFEKYNKVLIWCKAFGVLFGSAELSSK